MFPVQFTSAVIAIFTAIIGFYVTTVVEEIRSGTAVIYDVERHDRRAVVFLKNASREATVRNLHVGVSCSDFSKQTCFPVAPSEREISITRFAPISGNATAPRTTPVTLEFRATLVAGAEVQVTIPSNSENKSDLLFVYFPNFSEPVASDTEPTLIETIRDALKNPSPPQETPVFLERGSLTALFVEYYFSFMALAMLVTTILLLISMGWWAYSSVSNAVETPGEPKDDVQKLVVDLVVSSREPGG